MNPLHIALLILVFALIGFVVWIIITYIPMPDLFKKVIIVVCAVLVVLYLISIIASSPGFRFS